MKYINCPLCGKQLINLGSFASRNIFDYWCDHCKIEITIKTEGAEEYDFAE